MTANRPQAEPEQPLAGNPCSAEKLLAPLEEQLALYKKLKELTGRQRELVSEEDPAALLALLGERQQLLDQLAALDGEVAPIRRSWDRLSSTLPGAVLRRATAVFQESRRLLENILASDQKDTELLEGRKANVAEALQTIGAARQTHAAYGQRGPNLSKYFDGTDQEP